MNSRVRHFSTFSISPRVPPNSGTFFLAYQRGIVCFPKNVRFDRPQCDRNFEITIGGQKIKMRKSLQMGVR